MGEQEIERVWGGNAAGMVYREEGLGVRAGRIAELSNQVFQKAGHGEVFM